jgi:hypothetical protein
VFNEQTSVRDMMLTNINSKLIQQWRSFHDNNLSLANLESGMYELKVITGKSGEQYSSTIMVTDY